MCRWEAVKSPFSSFHSGEQEKAREQPGQQVTAVYTVCNIHTHNPSLNQLHCAVSNCLGNTDTLLRLEKHKSITKMVVFHFKGSGAHFSTQML